LNDAEVSFAFFDVDHTLLEGSTGKYLADVVRKRGLLPFSLLLKLGIFYFQYRTGWFHPHHLWPLLQKLKGVDIKEVQELAEEVFLNKVKPNLYQEAVELIVKEREAGRCVILATSAPRTLVLPLAAYLEIDHVISTQMEVREGRITGAFEDSPAFGAEKHRKVADFVAEHGGSLSRCSFYSDSYYDLPLLEEVQEAVAVNPDRRLRKEARRRGWKVLRFERKLGQREVEVGGGGCGKVSPRS